MVDTSATQAHPGTSSDTKLVVDPAAAARANDIRSLPCGPTVGPRLVVPDGVV